METDDYLPISGLQHLAFCERQCALIHIEGIWAENRLTIEGRHLHERVDDSGCEVRDGVRVARGLPLRCDRLKLVGKADAVEFLPQGPFPVEYKRGARRRWGHDEVQVCAQALCLEEMLGTPVPRGAIFYGKSRRRLEVEFDEALRSRTEHLARRFHEMFRLREVPRAVYMRKCDNCSLIDACMPKLTGSASAYLARLAEGGM